MLSLYLGEMNDVSYGPLWFEYEFEPSWLEDSFIQQMILDVDKSKCQGGSMIMSDVMGPISPMQLSGGVQTLIMIYMMPDRIFDATSCGGNCARWLLEIGRRKDVTVNLNYFMEFDGLDPFEVKVINTDYVAHSSEELDSQLIKVL